MWKRGCSGLQCARAREATQQGAKKAHPRVGEVVVEVVSLMMMMMMVVNLYCCIHTVYCSKSAFFSLILPSANEYSE